MDTHALLVEAIKEAGSEAKLAAKAGCSQVAINKAKKARRISPAMAIMLEHATRHGRHVWRPDMWPVPVPPAKPTTSQTGEAA